MKAVERLAFQASLGIRGKESRVVSRTWFVQTWSTWGTQLSKNLDRMSQKAGVEAVARWATRGVVEPARADLASIQATRPEYASGVCGVVSVQWAQPDEL